MSRFHGSPEDLILSNCGRNFHNLAEKQACVYCCVKRLIVCCYVVQCAFKIKCGCKSYIMGHKGQLLKGSNGVEVNFVMTHYRLLCCHRTKVAENDRAEGTSVILETILPFVRMHAVRLGEGQGRIAISSGLRTK